MNRNEFFQALPLTRLAVRLTNATLEICTDDIEDVHVMIAGDKTEVDALRVNVAGDTLNVEQPMKATAKSAAVATSWMQIAIRVPRTWRGRMEARTVTGWMNLRGLRGTDLTLDTVSGMVMASEMEFITISTKAVIGDVKLSGVKCERCAMSSTSGDLTLAASSISTGSASTVTGQVTLNLLTPFEEISMNAVTGDLSIDSPVAECDAVLRSVSGRIRTDGVYIREGGPKLRATTVSSDLDIGRNDSPAFSNLQ